MTSEFQTFLNSFLVILQGVPCRPISMGQGQEVHARRLLAQSMSDGGWLLLQNCHLGLDFLDEGLDTVTTAENIQDSFRLWVTTEVHPKFPINFLQSSIKFTNEPPQGREGEILFHSIITRSAFLHFAAVTSSFARFIIMIIWIFKVNMSLKTEI